MSFVEDTERGVCNFKTKGVLKLLDTSIGWYLVNRGGLCEKFVHESGWWFYTGVSFFTLHNGGRQIDLGFLKHTWFKFTKKEEKFVKAWLKFNKEKLGE